MKRFLSALVLLLLLLLSGLTQAQDADREHVPGSSLINSTVVVSVDADGNVGGDFTNGFIPSELLDVVWIDVPKHGTVEYDSEHQLVSYQPDLDNFDELDEFTIYAMEPGKAWNITRCFFDPATNELVFSTKVLNNSFDGASFDPLGRPFYCSLSNGSSCRDGWTQFWGGVKLVGGLVETGGGVVIGVFGSATIIGAVAGGGIAAHGLDNVQAGIRQLWSGEEVRTYTSQGVSETAHHVFGVEEHKAVVIGEIVDAGIGVFGGVGTATKVPQIVDKYRDVFQLSARTRLLLAGSGKLDDTIDISADVSKIVKLSGTITGGINTAEGGFDLREFYSQLPDEFADGVTGISRVGTPKSGVREIPVDDLIHTHPVPRPGHSVDKIAKQIKENGFDQSRAIEVLDMGDGKMILAGGNHRLAAMCKLGEKTIPAKVVDWSSLSARVRDFYRNKFPDVFKGY